MRTAREFDPSKKLYAKKSVKYSGRLYNRGDEFPSRDVTNQKLLKLFQNGFLGHSEDFRDNKSVIKEVELKEETTKESEAPEQKPSEETEVKSEEPVQEESKPTQQKKTRRKYTKKSDTSSD